MDVSQNGLNAANLGQLTNFLTRRVPSLTSQPSLKKTFRRRTGLWRSGAYTMIRASSRFRAIKVVGIVAF